MKYKCPNKTCRSRNINKNGFDWRSSDSRRIQRYVCKECGKYFSAAIFSKSFNQKKRRLNHEIARLFCFGMSVNNIARYLNTSTPTVLRKLSLQAEDSKKINEMRLRKFQGKVRHFEFDELITYEHTKCKPLSVAMAVEKDSGLILGFEVSQSPATGRLSKISKQRYGPRPSREKEGLNVLFEKIKPFLAKKVLVESDQRIFYKSVVKNQLSAAKIEFEHAQYKGENKRHGAQGEMKVFHREFDPLFWINHTFAMLRYGISRLVRKTWCNTKKRVNLCNHLNLFIEHHNKHIIDIYDKLKFRKNSEQELRFHGEYKDE